MKRLFHSLLNTLIVLAFMGAQSSAKAQTSFDISVDVDGCVIMVTVESSDTSRDFLVNVNVYDDSWNLLYSDSYDGFLPVTRSIVFTQSYSGTVYVEYEVSDFILGEAEREMDCTVQAMAPAQTQGTPCGPALTGIGQGLLVRPTPLYWAPRQNAASNVILDVAPNAKTYWVLGMDATRSFYKIVIACKTYWVPLDTLVPNPDNIWRGAPLPTRIVD
jgi:hypothetical protein